MFVVLESLLVLILLSLVVVIGLVSDLRWKKRLHVAERRIEMRKQEIASHNSLAPNCQAPRATTEGGTPLPPSVESKPRVLRASRPPPTRDQDH